MLRHHFAQLGRDGVAPVPRLVQQERLAGAVVRRAGECGAVFGEGRRLPDTVSREEMNLILSQPGDQTPAALRDTAMLELLYATGLRVSELISLTMNSINWQVGFLIVMGKGSKERVVPIGKTALRLVESYLKAVRPFLLRDPQETALFLTLTT